MISLRTRTLALAALLLVGAVAASRTPAAVVTPPLPVAQFPSEVGQACDIWHDLGWPQADAPTDYPAGDYALVIRGDNVFTNVEGELPAAGHYREYDVNPREVGAHRDAERLVRDPGSGAVWYTADHYASFRQIASGCP